MMLRKLLKNYFEKNLNFFVIFLRNKGAVVTEILFGVELYGNYCVPAFSQSIKILDIQLLVFCQAHMNALILFLTNNNSIANKFFII